LVSTRAAGARHPAANGQWVLTAGNWGRAFRVALAAFARFVKSGAGKSPVDRRTSFSVYLEDLTDNLYEAPKNGYDA
jgi:hypothetical protein